MHDEPCLRCERPVLDPFNLCESCIQREIDARGRYVRKDPA